MFVYFVVIRVFYLGIKKRESLSVEPKGGVEEDTDRANRCGHRSGATAYTMIDAYTLHMCP